MEALKQSLGSKKQAFKVALRAQKFIPAYQNFLLSQGCSLNRFEELPTTDKQSYLLNSSYQELMGDNFDKMLAIFRSSGSSGSPFFWPSLRETNRWTTRGARLFLERSFAVHKRKTLVIVGLRLGSWLPGEQMSWGLKNLAMSVPYPLCVFTPGNDLDEITLMINKMEPLVEQIILLIVPSAIAHLHLKASQLPLQKLRYVVLSEPFPENLRSDLAKRAGMTETSPYMFSMYGSTDTGGLGVESLASVALRKLLVQNPDLATQLGFKLPTPLFFHCIAFNSFLETVEGSLCITQWQGIPLIRYLLHDEVNFYSWQKLRKLILTSNQVRGKDEPFTRIIQQNRWLPNLIAVTGRKDCLILGGTNLYEYMLDQAVREKEIAEFLTGLYKANIIYEGNRQYLFFLLEMRPDIEIQKAEQLIVKSLVSALRKLSSSFNRDWQNIYSQWENDPHQNIVRVNLVPYPALSQTTENSIKFRGTRN